MIDDSKIFFLGAGFSKAIDSNFPLLANLTKELLGENFEKLPEYARKDSLPISCLNSFESLLTFLYTDLPWKSDLDRIRDKALYQFIANKINDYFVNGLLYYDITQGHSFDILWKYINKMGSPIITLNYDLILEKCLELNSRYNDRIGMVSCDANSYEGYYRGKVVDIRHIVYHFDSVSDLRPEILKLHGSANWYYNGDDKYSPIFCGNNETKAEFQLIQSYKPFIIPPVFDKTKFYSNKTLEYMWTKAFNYIAKAKEIYIIGFSFPETDLSVKYLFENALKLNGYAPKVFVINTNTHKNFKTKYEKIFGKGICNFEYCQENALNEFMNKKLKPMLLEVNNATN